MSDAASSQVDEQRIAKLVGVGLPAATVAAAVIVGVIFGPATSLLVLTAGLLLGVIALLWGSIRVLSGDAPLSPELEALDMAARGEDALSSRKTMLLRALKDLENERGIGKIEDDDYEQISSVYRNELKTVLRMIDDALAPHREKAEALALEHLARAGLTNGASTAHAAKRSEEVATEAEPRRLACPKCEASNEPDAKFCKECATPLGATPSVGAARANAAEGGEVVDDE